MRWRLRLAEYHFVIHHKKGKAHCQADALSRVDSDAHTTEHEDMELPCFIIGESPPAIGPPMPLDHHQDEEVEPHPYGEEPLTLLDLILAFPDKQSELPTPISIEELIEAQAQDAFCKSIASSLERGRR